MPEAPVPIELAHGRRHMLRRSLDLLQAENIRRLALNPVHHLARASTNAVHVPRRDLHEVAVMFAWGSRGRRESPPSRGAEGAGSKSCATTPPNVRQFKVPAYKTEAGARGEWAPASGRRAFFAKGTTIP